MTSTPTRPVDKCCYNNERPTGQKQQLFDGMTVENKGKLILTDTYLFKMHSNIVLISTPRPS